MTPKRLLGLALPVLALLLFVGRVTPLVGQAQRQRPLRFLIVDTTGHAIEGANVTIPGARGVTTNASGRADLPAPSTDSVNVVVRAVGFELREVSIGPREREDLLRIVLHKPGQRLPDIAVEGQPDTPLSRRLKEFYWRKAHTHGFFITREMIDKSISSGIEDLLSEFAISGLKADLRFVRCSGPSTKVGVWINGWKSAAKDPREALATLHALDIEGIEVYRGVAELPPEFISDNCAAIVVWTK